MLEHDGADVRSALRKLQEMAEFCESAGCRRKQMLKYFGEEYTESACGKCDACENPRETFDGTEIATTIIECIRQLPMCFGTDLITDVLIGAKTAKIRSYFLDTLPGHGSGKSHTKTQLRAWISELIREEYLERDGDKYPVIRLTQKGAALQGGNTTVMLTVQKVKSSGLRGSARDSAAASPSDADLFTLLRDLRKKIVDEAKILPYMVFADKSLHEMARVRPCTVGAFSTISGVGEFKKEKYGHEFVAEIRKFGELHADRI